MIVHNLTEQTRTGVLIVYQYVFFVEEVASYFVTY